MDNRTIRLLNLKHLEMKFGRQKLIEADERKIWSESYINQLCGGFGSFGASTARRLERGLGLPKGWMDLIHLEVGYSLETEQVRPPIQELISIANLMPPELLSQYISIGNALLAHAAIMQNDAEKT